MNSGYFFPRLIPFIKVKLADLSGVRSNNTEKYGKILLVNLGANHI